MTTLETCKYWKYGFCSREDKCKFLHPEEEFGIERDPNLPEEVTNGEQKSGNRIRAKRARYDESEYDERIFNREGVTVEVRGIPADAEIREVTQIFRQYTGFNGCKLHPGERDFKVCQVQMADHEHADYLRQTLNGYQFDERNLKTFLKLTITGSGGKGKGKGGKGKGKGKGKY